MKKFDVQEIADVVGPGPFARCVYAVSLMNNGKYDRCYCPLVVFAQKRHNFQGTPADVVEYLTSCGYDANFLWGFVNGFDGQKPNEFYKKFDGALDGWRVGYNFYRYCKANNLIVVGG